MSVYPNDPADVAEVAHAMADIDDEFEEIVTQGREGGDEFEDIQGREEDYSIDGICFVIAVIGVAIVCQLFWRK